MDAKEVPLDQVVGDDTKWVLSAGGHDLTGVTITFEISAGPEQPAIVTAAATLLAVVVDDDGIPTSVVEVFKAAGDVRTAVNSVGGLPGNEPLALFYQLKFNKLPGDAGSAAITTIMFGDYTMRGEVNG